jgi:hypothetical protein
MPRKLFAVGIRLGIALFAALLAQPCYAQATEARPSAVPPACDRQCLYGFLDQYLHALVARDPSRLHWAKMVQNTENNVSLQVGDGLWGTITGLGSYDLRFADTTNGQVGFYGVVQEKTVSSVIALRLKIDDGAISEVETLVRRNEGSSLFPNPPVLVEKPVLNEIVPPEQRRPRERMIAIANGYWDTLQLNDGTLFTQFDDNCDRIENGLQTTRNPKLLNISPVATLGCADQFKMGHYRFDDRLRARRFPIVDEERGLVLSAAFLDHAGRLGTYKYTDGRVVESSFKTPSSLCALELFKIVDGKIRQIEAVFISVPYNMPSPWVP